MDTDSIEVNVSSPGLSADKLKEELFKAFGNADGIEIRLPKPKPGGLPMLDPSVIQILVALASAGGAAGLALKGAFGCLEKWITTRNAPLTIKVGPNSLSIPAKLSADERNRMFDDFLAKVSKRAR